MQSSSPCIDACKTFTVSHQHFLGFRTSSSSSSPTLVSFRKSYNCVSCRLIDGKGSQGRERVKGRGKDNVWSVDNEMAEAAEKERERDERRKKKKGKRMKSVGKREKGDDKVLVSGSMLMEIETVLQTQEPVIQPAWNTFASSVSGIWKGVGAVFSPITAEMQPVDIGNKNENLYDCYTLSRIEAVPSPSGGQTSQIQRKINWVSMNPYGENRLLNGGSNSRKEKSEDGDSLPTFESFDLTTSDVMEEDVMGMEPGLVFFEDGSYSRGPVDVPIAEPDESTYYLSPTFKFEQCLVKGCHKRLRIVHTVELGSGGSDIQIMRVAVYEEQWASPANIQDQSDLEFDLKPFSQRKRTQPSELTGSWKVFEVSATPIYAEESITEETKDTPYVYLCTETLKKRSLPEIPVLFKEEEMLDMQDVTVLWLPGGVTAYVDVSEDGILCIGVGWYSDEGINLVMERDYGVDGKLREVRSKSEIKRRWSDPVPV
ncbi:hypothetical protein Vadar_019261 [Vaccinium darrowii]|uniref:Uncharacterized protein n=1 Tax=Vaccinium darrowii TaxID=229202 RepID=A0ACB7ZDR3_9ERIC|nr:hypothetical protein Vadar_019261 [Vaccinium darrowii]